MYAIRSYYEDPASALAGLAVPGDQASDLLRLATVDDEDPVDPALQP